MALGTTPAVVVGHATELCELTNCGSARTLGITWIGGVGSKANAPEGVIAKAPLCGLLTNGGWGGSWGTPCWGGGGGMGKARWA